MNRYNHSSGGSDGQDEVSQVTKDGQTSMRQVWCKGSIGPILWFSGQAIWWSSFLDQKKEPTDTLFPLPERRRFYEDQ